MDRRTFLWMSSLTVAGLGTLGAGCVPIAARSGRNSETAQDMAAARAILEQLDATGTLAGGSPLGTLRGTAQNLRGVTLLSASQTLQLAEAVFPALRRLRTARTQGKRALRKKGSTVKAVNGVFAIEPGEALEFSCRGYCMDPSRAVPSRGEPLGFKPMSQYVPPELQELFSKTLHLAATRKNVHADMQKLVWAFRTVTQERSSWADGLNRREYELLDAAMPGGAQRFMQARRELSGRYTSGPFDFGQMLERMIPRFQPVDFSKESDALMSQLMTMTVSEPIPPGDYQYSMLAPGVAAKGVGQGGLSAYGIIANTSDQTFVFDPMQWALESPREVQRVAMLPPDSGVITAVPEGDDTASLRQALEDLLRNKQPDPKEFCAATAFWGQRQAGGVKQWVSNANLLGAMSATFEGIHGQNWQAEPVTAAERVLGLGLTQSGYAALQKAFSPRDGLPGADPTRAVLGQCAQYLGVELNQVSCGAPEGVQQALDEGFFIKASRAITSLLDKAGWKDNAPMLPVGWLGIRG